MRFSQLAAGILFAGMFAGCATIGPVVNQPPAVSRNDVFVETADTERLPDGTAALEITMYIKTPYAGYFLLGSRGIPHGTNEYPFLLNIDGQAVEWNISGLKETKPVRDTNGTRAPEGGEGVGYFLKKRIRIPPGPHRVFFSLPAEGVSTGVDITIKEKGIYSLVLEPVYGKGVRYPNGHFTRGVKELRKTFSLTWVQCG